MLCICCSCLLRTSLSITALDVTWFLPGRGTSAGFHTHGPRKEQEIYCVVHGEGIYRDMDGATKQVVREQEVRRGSVTSVQGPGFHSIVNTGSRPVDCIRYHHKRTLIGLTSTDVGARKTTNEL